jgi:hypothetical protein
MIDYPAYHKILDSVPTSDDSRPDYQVRPVSIREFFGSGTVKKIPDYQRPYAWDDANVADLWNDVLKASRANSGWFLGPVFTVKRAENSRVEELLDGQQRVTTLQLILKELTFVMSRLEAFDWGAEPELKGSLSDVVAGAQNCIFSPGSSSKELRFETEPISEEILKKYLLTRHDEPVERITAARKEFQEFAERKRIEGSKTAGRLNKTVLQIHELFGELCGNCGKEDVERLIQFGSTILNNVWLIQIPLRKEKYTEEIFEGLNNRGKSLSLVSKLRFKCLLHAAGQSVNVRLKWKKVYAGLELMDDLSFIKSDDDFFKVYINCIDGAGHTKERDLVNHFMKKCIFEEDKNSQSEDVKVPLEPKVSQRKLAASLDEIINIQSFYGALGKNLSGKSMILDKFRSKEEREKVKALLEVLKHCLKFSDNSRFLLFNAIKNKNWSTSDDETKSLLKQIWKIICAVFLTEIVNEEKSNQTRTDYLGTLKPMSSEGEEARKSLNDLYLEKDKLSEKPVAGMLRTTDSDCAKFILSLYALFEDPEALISFSPEQMKGCHLEHLWPQAFQSNWGEVSGYTVEEVSGCLEEIAENYSHITKNQVLDAARLDDLTLREYTTKPFSQKNSLIQWIGNKWILHAGTNIKGSNDTFAEKYVWFQKPTIVKVPSNDVARTGIDWFKERGFNHSSVINRSFEILNGVVRGVQSTETFV